ncbi:MAG TPA: bifunctional phosphoglucose/phosphomannose isomerase [Saprospiraceae bacterium]|nr:bifunctional phosphoglucose/phosphomannose isomerase [Saprospiraceae bacterium]
MMDQLISRFTEQLEEALEIGKNASIHPLSSPIQHIYVSGMGGSGIGADFVASFIYDECKVPYLVGKGYDIPAYIGPQSLTLASSYSGNTEETLTAFDAIQKTGSRTICIASGGKVITTAKKLGLDFVKLPDTWPSPRACLGFSVVAQLCILQKLGLIGNSAIEEVRKSITLLNSEEIDIKARAEKVAHMIFGKLPVIYATDRYAPVAVRFRQQVNENAKSLGWHHIIPEMNHNELVGWRDQHQDLAVIWFRSRNDHPRNQVRIDINKEIIGNYTSTLIELYAKGDSQIQQSLYLVHLGDWISWYLAQLRGVDAIEVKVIDFLKGELGKV